MDKSFLFLHSTFLLCLRLICGTATRRNVKQVENEETIIIITPFDDSLIVEGSSEALFHRIYPVPAVRENLKVGALIAKEAESLDRLRFVGTAEERPRVPSVLRTYRRQRQDSLYSYSGHSISVIATVLRHKPCQKERISRPGIVNAQIFNMINKNVFAKFFRKNIFVS